MADVTCARCKGEEVIWGGCMQDGDSNYFDPCPECQGFDPDDGQSGDAQSGEEDHG